VLGFRNREKLMNWIENQGAYVVYGWWPASTLLTDEFGAFVLMLSNNSVWRVQIRPLVPPSHRTSRYYDEQLWTRRQEPYLLVDRTVGQGKDIFLYDATKQRVLDVIQKIVGSADFPTIFRPAGDVSHFRTTEFTSLSTEKTCEHEYIQSLRKEYANGTVVLNTFQSNDGPLSMPVDAYVPPPLLAFLLISNPSIQVGLDDLKLSEANLQTLIFSEPIDLYRLLGVLLHTLRAGGAYYQSQKSFAEDMQITANFLEQLLGDKKDYVTGSAYGGAWTPFFFDIAWDHTYVLIQRETGRIHFLYMTDTD
jgi:hypothetical protein